MKDNYRNRLASAGFRWIGCNNDCVVKQEIHVGKSCSGLSYHNDKLYVLVKSTGIMEFDVARNLIRTIPE